jgi:hypothetical protein
VSLLLLSAASHIAVLAHDGKELLLTDENPAVAAAMLVVTLFPLLLLLTRVVPHACQDYVIASCVEVRTRQQKERNEGDNRPLAPFGCDTIVLSRKNRLGVQAQHKGNSKAFACSSCSSCLFCSGLVSVLSVAVVG